jgi:Rhs element Vgr protein
MNEVSLTNTSTHDVVSYDLLIDGKQIAPEYQVKSVAVLKEINRVPSARIVMRDGEASRKDFEISARNDFVPGKKVAIKIGRDGTNAEVFQGVIVRHSIKIKNSGHSELQLECFDETVKMTIGRHSRYFEDRKDKDVFDDLVSRYDGIKSKADDTRLKHRELVQHHLSDWDFMLLRAEANGMLVNVTNATVVIARPDTTKKPALQVTYGASVIELEAEIDARLQWKNVQGASWNYADQQLFSADAAASAINEPGNLSGSELAKVSSPDKFELRHSGHVMQQELQDWVDATLMRSRLSKIRGRAKFIGVSSLNPGDMIQLAGIGDRFNGNAFVTAVRHEVGDGIWDTHIQFGLDPQRHASLFSDVNEVEASGLIGAIKGLQIGKVVQLQNDPDGQHRILVKVPVIDNNGKGTWMRVASLDAGKDRGAFFRPERNDEVIVGFINDDPRDAVVLGMLHSSAKPAPITAKDENHEKGFTTRSKMHVSFNDDTRTITIDTPAGNKVKLDERGKTIEIVDQNKNSIKMNSKGIEMKSDFNIDLTAGANLTLKAGTSLSIGGASISVKADGNVSMEGAMAKISGQGIAELSGGLVKIN